MKRLLISLLLVSLFAALVFADLDSDSETTAPEHSQPEQVEDNDENKDSKEMVDVYSSDDEADYPGEGDEDADEDLERHQTKTITVRKRVCVRYRVFRKKCRHVLVQRTSPKVCKKFGMKHKRICTKYGPAAVRKRKCVMRRRVCIKRTRKCVHWRQTHEAKTLCVRCCTCLSKSPKACSCKGYKNGVKCKHGRLNVPYRHFMSGPQTDFRKAVKRALEDKKYKKLRHRFVPLLRYCIERKHIKERKVCVRRKKVCEARALKCVKRQWVWSKVKNHKSLPKRCIKYKWRMRRYCKKYRNGVKQTKLERRCEALKKPVKVCVQYQWRYVKLDPIVKVCPCMLEGIGNKQ